MGARDSKPSCISYEDAVKRVSDGELRRIKEAFKRSTGSNGTTLSKSAFLQDVLSDGVPPVLADWLYVACGGTQKGIAFKELLCGLVLLTRGLPDEKIKFLWNVYCNDSGTHITKLEFLKALQIEETYQPTSKPSSSNRAIESQTHLHSILTSLFANSDRVGFDQFRIWITRHERATVLSRWLMIDSGVNLTTELETPTFYQSLAGVTHLEEQDIGDLEKVFWFLKGLAKTGQLDLESLGPLISPPVPPAALAGVFLAFDENRDGHIDFKELCCGVSAACRGPSVERSKFCFKVFDVDSDGVLNVDEIKDMIHILISVSKENSSSNSNSKNYTYEQVLNDLQSRMGKQTTVEKIESNDSIPGSFTFSQDDFMLWSVQSQLNLVQPFLDLLFEVCHIVLGLRPQCRHLEHNIVKGWLEREVSRGYKVGQFWYLISADWWNNWQQYTQSSLPSPCAFCKTASNYTISRHITSGNSVDEAVICDESFTSNSTESMGDLLCTADSSSLGSGSSGISVGGRNGNQPPGPIDNTNLIEPSVYKNVQTLTGEGGRLKRNLILAEHRDYELVPDNLWKALSQWYRGPLALPRQVILPHSSMPVELELYPLNLRILRHQTTTPIAQTVSSWGAVAGGYGAVTSAGNYTTNSVPSLLQPPKRYLAYTAAFSRLSTVKQVGEFMCQHLKLKFEDLRLWHVYNLGENACLLEEDSLTLQDLAISDNDQILLEIRNKDLTWPEELGSLSLSQSSSTALERRATIASIQSVHAPGATGLHNLGNTCFMNSALQVLFNTQPLTQYFRQNMHLYELNTTNKLGTKGQLALRYSELLKEVWTASTRSIAPLKLRFCMTKHAPQFAGGGQHDSQELLEWLLDGLHEDLNRVMEKPYSELKDSDGRADGVVAAEAWSQHHARNQSIVIDLFYGQLKSKVSCLNCGRDSVRFDPFSLLSLPLPVENYTYCEVLVILLDGSVPTKYGLRLNSDSRYSDLKKELSTLCGLHQGLMLVCELSNSQIRCALPDGQKLKVSTATDLFIYEIPKGDFWKMRSNSDAIMNIEQGLKDIQRNPALQIMSPDPHQLTTTSTISTCTSSSSDEKTLINGTVPFTITTQNVPRTSKHSKDLSTSPDNTFSHANASRKESMSTMLLERSSISKGSKSLSNVSTIERYKSLDCSDTITHVNVNGIDNNTSELAPCSESINELPKDNELTSNNKTKCDNIDKNKQFVDDNAEMKDSDLGDRRSGGYLIAVHRKLTRQDTYFLSYHKSRPSLFGVPLLIPCYEDGTNKDLYCAVWIQVARLLSPLPSTPPDQSNHATDCDDSLGYEFPFILRAVSEGGRICALCPWSKFCRGCEIPCNDLPLLNGKISSTNNSNSSTPILSMRDTPSNNTNTLFADGVNPSAIHIAIDWDPTALHLRYQSTREKVWTEHESVALCRKQQTEPVDLDHCLRAFTSEEKLEQCYHCAHCKSKQPATKKLQIWKLPPILIVHLKRFNYVNNKWVKSQKVVNFPFENFDPTPYLASVPQETILRHKELQESAGDSASSNRTATVFTDIEIDQFDRESTMAGIQEGRIEEEDTINDTDVEAVTTHEPSHITTAPQDGQKFVRNSTSCSRRTPNKTIPERKRLVSTSLTKTPIIDGALVDYHDHRLRDGDDPFEMKYKLYAVVSHSGMLNGGHYISYARNPNNSWYCYNDSSCREILTQPNIDPSSAYLLFYERQGLDYLPYLPSVGDRPIPAASLAELDDTDNDLRKMCVIA